MPENVFGLDDPVADETVEDPFADIPTPAEEAAVEEAPVVEEAEPPVETPGGADPLAAEVPAAEESASQVAPTEEVAGTPYAGRYAEKYQTVEAVDEAYRNALDLQQRQAERARTSEQENLQLREYLRVAGQMLEERQKEAAKPAPTQADVERQAEELGIDPDTLRVAQQLAAQQAAERVAPLEQQLQYQQQQWSQQQQLIEQRDRTTSQINAFRSAHADEITPEVENSMVSVFNDFGLDTTVPDNYSIALEAAKDPRLYRVLRANPAYIDTDEGMEYAREQASIRTAPPSTPSERETQVAEQRRMAQVEGGSSGAAPSRAAEAKPKDAWDEVLEVAKADRGGKSVFGV